MRTKIISIFNKLLFFNPRKTCPACGSSFFSYLPLPEKYEKMWRLSGFPYRAEDFETLNANNFSCPACYSTDRDRLVTFYLKDLVRNSSDGNLKILDIAPSKALGGWIKSNMKADYKTADLFMDGVDYTIDIENMSTLSDDSFDLILCSHVLEHVPNDRQALSELKRVLAAGGKVVLLVPIVKQLKEIIEDPLEDNESRRWKRFGQNDHIRLYSSEGFLNRIKESGLCVEKFVPDDFGIDCVKNGITPQSVLYIATK